MSDFVERASAAVEEAMREIAVCEGADGLAYGLLDAIAEARGERDLKGAGDVLRDASLDVARAALSALDLEDEALVEFCAQKLADEATAARNELRLMRNGIDLSNAQPVSPAIFRAEVRLVFAALKSASLPQAEEERST